MFTDPFGTSRVKVNLHMHTTISDGHLSPEEAIAVYKSHGYDAVALTDHWKQGKPYVQSGITILAGCEFNVGADTRRGGVYHIVGIGMEKEVFPSDRNDPQSVIDAIHEANGLAILAHPAWSINTCAQILALRNVDATEIYNTVSDFAVSYRADSSETVDQLGVAGCFLPLLATDDVHYYSGDECKSYILVEAETVSREVILSAIREKRFYASQGPQMHVQFQDGVVSVDSTPASRIIFHTGCVWNAQSVVRGENLTHAEYRIGEHEHFLRVSVTDRDGNRAWSNFVYQTPAD